METTDNRFKTLGESIVRYPMKNMIKLLVIDQRQAFENFQVFELNGQIVFKIKSQKEKYIT